MENISFDAAEMITTEDEGEGEGEGGNNIVVVDRDVVEERLGEVMESSDLSRYIL